MSRWRNSSQVSLPTGRQLDTLFDSAQAVREVTCPSDVAEMRATHRPERHDVAHCHEQRISAECPGHDVPPHHPVTSSSGRTITAPRPSAYLAESTSTPSDLDRGLGAEELLGDDAHAAALKTTHDDAKAHRNCPCEDWERARPHRRSDRHQETGADDHDVWLKPQAGVQRASTGFRNCRTARRLSSRPIARLTLALTPTATCLLRAAAMQLSGSASPLVRPLDALVRQESQLRSYFWLLFISSILASTSNLTRATGISSLNGKLTMDFVVA